MNAREVKNQLVIDGTIDAAFKTLLKCQEPDAWRAALIELAHAAVDASVAAECERWRKAAVAALEIMDDLPAWSNAGHACKLLRDAVGPDTSEPGVT